MGQGQPALEDLVVTASSPDAGFWSGKRVLVTGHTGFKGAWLSLWLQRMGAQVSGFALPPERAEDLFDVARVGAGMDSREGDIRELPTIEAVVRDTEPEIIFHLAAQSLVRPSYEDPVETYATNVMGTVHLLESVRRVDSARVVVCVTSDKCYENREWIWGYRERDPMGGHDPYSSSKGCSELVVSAYRRSFFEAGPEGHGVTQLASARAGNVIGGGDWSKDRLVPDIFRGILAGRPVEIRRPEAVRPWQHVLDPLNGYLTLAAKLWSEGPRFAEGWNFGPESADARTVGWITDEICRRWGSGAEWIGDEGPHPHEAHHLRLDCSKARERLGWTPRLTLSDALDLSIDWYRDWGESGDMRVVTDRQIDSFAAAGQA